MNFAVKKVVFYEDRACVIREVEAELEAGIHSYEIDELSPFIVDKSVMLDTSSDDVLCSELKISRKFVGDKLVSRKIEEQIIDIDYENKAKELLQQSLDNINETRKILLRKISTDTAKGIAEPKKWRESLNKLQEKEYEIHNKMQTITEAIESKNLYLSDKQIAYKNLDDLPVWRSTIKVSLECRKKCKVKLTLRYMTAAACWRPCAEAFIKSNNITFKLCARLWQNTGEIWENIEYQLSTERLSRGGDLPSLQTDYISTHKKPPETLRFREESRKTNVEVRQIEDVPGIQDNGHSYLANSKEQISFPENEQSMQVSYWEFNSEILTTLIACPMLSEYVNEVVTFFNYGEIPVLECPVSIYRNNILLGQSRIKYKSPGEKIELDCGNIPEIRIKRKVTKKKIINFWKTTENTVQLYISNLSSKPFSFELKERLPVSETDKVVIAVNEEKTVPAKFPDKEGIMSWIVNCPANGRRKIKLNYQIKIHSGTVEMSIPV